MAPFATLAERYGDDLAIVWIDSHPDVDTPDTDFAGHHAMAVTALSGHDDPDVLAQLPATVPAERVALAVLHALTEDAYSSGTERRLKLVASPVMSSRECCRRGSRSPAGS